MLKALPVCLQFAAAVTLANYQIPRFHLCPLPKFYGQAFTLFLFSYFIRIPFKGFLARLVEPAKF